MMIRDSAELMTIRFRVVTSRAKSGRLALLASYHRGAREVGHPLEIALEDLDLPQRLRLEEISSRPQVPQMVVEAFRRFVEGAQRQDGEPLWLLLDPTAAYAAIVPWEGALIRGLDRPVLRIPYFLAPSAASPPKAVAVCASAPRAKGPFHLPDYIRRAVSTLAPLKVDLHVFADEGAYAAIQSLAGSGVVIHDPGEMAGRQRPGPTGVLDPRGDRVRSPWLLWMQAKLAEGVDAVHFITPGYLADDQAALALASAPWLNEDPTWSHFVSGRELTTFLNQVGASSLVLTQPLDDIWALGLRLLASEVAAARPGRVALYDSESGGPDGLEIVYEAMLSTAPVPARGDAAVAMYVHPQVFLDYSGDKPNPVVSTEAPLPPEIMRLVDISRSAAENTSDAHPLWYRAGRKSIDQRVTQLARSATQVELSARQLGASDATAWVSNLIERKVGEGQ